MTHNSNGSQYRQVLSEEESLAIFLRCMAKFDHEFCELMAGGRDFTLKMEIHGNKGELIHARVLSDGFERPRKAEKRIEAQMERKRPRL